MRTLLLASRISGRRAGRITLTGCGRGESTGREVMEVVRWARDSRRWVSDLDERAERWWENWVLEDGAERRRDCWLRVMASSVSQHILTLPCNTVFFAHTLTGSWCLYNCPAWALSCRL